MLNGNPTDVDHRLTHETRLLSEDGQGNKRRFIAMSVAGWSGLTFLAAAAGIGLGWIYTHPPRRNPPSGMLMEKLSIPYRPVPIRTSDGLHLAGWFSPSRNNGTILVTHGWGTCRLEAYHALFASHGFGVLSWDFRCHGRSQGENCSCGYYEARDIEAALDFVLDKEPETRIGLWGGSMGGTAGLRLAKDRPDIAAMVLDSVPSDISISIKKITKFSLAAWMMRRTAEGVTGVTVQDIQTVAWMRGFAPRPVLIIHGSVDNRLSDDCGRRLLEAAGENATLWYVSGSKHLALYEEQPQAYQERVIGFFDRTLNNTL